MKYLIAFCAIAFLLSGCEKIIAEDITGKLPVLILPTDGSTVGNNPVHFKWEEMEGATKYHLMVVSPSFASPNIYVLDTLVSGTEFHYSLDSNSYELKLVGVNGGYRSDTLGPIAFEVNTNPTAGSNSVVLVSPLDGEAQNASFSGNFTWQPVTNASSYEFSLREGTDFSTATIIDFSNGITTSNYTSGISIPEGEYIWGVKAYLSTGGETFFTTRQLLVDETAPNSAVLSSPANGSTSFLGTITFTWNNGTDPGTVNTEVTSQLEISTDISFLNSDFYDIIGQTMDLNLSTSGTYYWRVLNYDAAGNVAAVSATNNFTLF